MSKITPYTYDKEAFAHHCIIVGYLEKGLEYVTDDENFRKKVISKLNDKPESDVEYLYVVYDALGILPESVYQSTTQAKKERRENVVQNFLESYRSYNIYVTELEKKVAMEKGITEFSKKPTKTLENRKFELQVNEIACSIFAHRTQLLIDEMTIDAHLKNNTLTAINLFGERAGKGPVKLVVKVDENKQDKYTGITGFITENTKGRIKTMTYYISRNPKRDNYKEQIIRRLYDLNTNGGKGGEIKGLFTSSNELMFTNLEYMIKTMGAGNLINCPKLCRTAKEIPDTELDAASKKEKDGICFTWRQITDTMRVSNRISLYDYYSDVYFAGESYETTKRLVYGNFDVSKTLSVTIETGTFKTSVDRIDDILNMNSLNIDNSKLNAGETGVWNRVFGTTKPKDGNWLNLQDSNVMN